MEAFAWVERSFWSLELGFDAWGSWGGGASFVYGQQGASTFYYFLESFHLGGGRTIFMDSFLLRLSSSHQNWEITVADWSQQQDSHSCGGDSASDISGGFWSRSGSFRGGRTTFSSFWQYELDSFTILELLLYQVHYCIVFTALDRCSTDIYIIFQNWFSPGGVLSRVIDQKYLCLHMHFSCC